MKKTLYILAIATLFWACDKTENEQDILYMFFGESAQTGNEDEPQGLITVNKIDFSNANSNSILTDWGGTLYANQMRYLQIRIEYHCNTREQVPVTLFVKIFNPDGSLRQGTNSPDGYTFLKTFVSAGNKKKYALQELGGWGNASQSGYVAGTYIVELWEEYDEAEKIFATTVQMK